jgi:ABC-type multidrug transport system ATPase subunit
MAMTISLSDAGKRFNREWIFRHITYDFVGGTAYAITGPNGSGKSTLLQSMASSMHINEGKIEWKSSISSSSADKPWTSENVYNQISICAPYLDVVEEMTLEEFLHFHHGFKPFLPGITIESIVADLGLKDAKTKQIRYYSSGMKQRVKLAQCIFSDTEAVLLDEPCTNLDSQGIDLYHSLIEKHCSNRLVVVSSNDEIEYRFCQHRINISDYKS